jgi:hypothetical protein
MMNASAVAALDPFLVMVAREVENLLSERPTEALVPVKIAREAGRGLEHVVPAIRALVADADIEALPGRRVRYVAV